MRTPAGKLSLPPGAARFAQTMSKMFGPARVLMDIWDWANFINDMALQDQYGFAYNHPSNAELLQDCGKAPNAGPQELDGSCGIIINNDPAFYEAGFSPGYLENVNHYIWRYHDNKGTFPFPTTIRTVWTKASSWRALKASADQLPGPYRVLPLPLSATMPSVKIAADGQRETVTRTARPVRLKDEKQKGLAQRGYMLAVKAFDRADELAQTLDCLWKAIPKKCRNMTKPSNGRKKSRIEKAVDIYRCAGVLDLNHFAECYVWNQFVEDQIIGRAQKLGSQPIRGKFAPGSGPGIGIGYTAPGVGNRVG